MSLDRLPGFLLILFFCSAISRSVCAQDQRPELFLQLPHQGEVLDADFSPKGGYATAGQDGTVRIWSGESGLLSEILEAHPHGAMACRFDPSGNFLATGGVDGHVKIWETGNYRLVRDLATKHEIHSVEWSGDGKILAALDVLEEAFLWDASSGSHLSGNGNPVIYEKDHPDHQVYPFYDLRHHLAFAPDNEHLLVAKGALYAAEVIAPPGSPAWNVPPIFPASINSSPHANRIAITEMSNFLVYDGALSKVIARMNHGTSASPLRLSRDGKFAFYTDRNFAYVLDTENLKVVFSTSMKQEVTQGVWKFTAAAISSNSQSILLANDQGDFRIYRIASGQMVRQSPPHPQDTFVSFANDGTLALFGFGHALLLESDGHIRSVAIGSDFEYEKDFWSQGVLRSDKSGFVSAPDFGKAQFWDGATGIHVGATEDGHLSNILDLQVSHSGKLGATAACGDVFVFSIPEGAIQQKISRADCAASIRFSSDDKELVIGYAGTRKFADPMLGPPDSSAAEFNGIVVWDLERKRQKLELAGFSVPVNQVAISEDGRYLATAADDRKVILWDLQHGNAQVKSWTMTTSSERWYDHLRFGLTFSPRNNLLAISTPDEIMLCRIPSGEIARRISPAGAMAFSPEGSRLAVTHRRFARDPFQGTTLWDVESGTIVARIFTSGEDSYFLIDRDGYYISKGANRQISFRLAGQVYPSEEFDVKYDRPDRVLKTLGATDQVLIQDYAAAYQRRLQRLGITEDSVQATAALPEVKIISRETRNRELHLKVEARDSSSQLRKLLIADNGVVAISSEIPPSGAANWSADMVIPLSPGSNLVNVSVVAKNGRESRREMIAAYNDQQDQKHDLYVLAVGVSSYLARQYDLHYPDKDARQFVEVLQSQRSQYRQVHATVLLNEHATRTAILRAANELRSAKTEDAVILFFAGHGLVDERSQFFFGTFDVDFADPSKSGLPWDDLDSILASLSSRHKLVMMDSCHSGELDPQPAPVHSLPQSSPANSVVMRSAGGARGSHLMNESQEETSTELLTEDFEDLRRGTGASVIGASAGSEFSFESESLKNGVFTHVILEGIASGKADLNQDGKITVEELKRYAAQQVSALTGGKQHPVSRAGSPDMDFTVALPQNLLFVRMLETWAEAIGVSRDLKYLSMIVNSTLRTWDIPSGTEIRRQPLPPGLRTLVVNGSTIRVTNGSAVWDFPAGPGPLASTVNAGRYNSIDPPVLSPDGKRFAYFDVGDTQRGPKGVLVNADSGKIIASWRQPDYKSNLQKSAFSPDGRSFAVFMGNGELMIRDGLSGEKQTRIRTPEAVDAIAFSHSGYRLAAATRDNRVLLFNLLTKGQPRSLGIQDKQQYFPALLFSDDDKLLITGSSDGYIRLFSTANGTLVGEIWNADWAYRLLLPPGSHILAVGGFRGSVRLWDLSPWLSPH